MTTFLNLELVNDMQYAEQIIGWLTTYWWAIHAIVTSSFMGYAWVQRRKRKIREMFPNEHVLEKLKRKGKVEFVDIGKLKRDERKRDEAGICTALCTFGFWFTFDHNLTHAFLMAIICGMCQPWIVHIIMGLVKRFAPVVYEEVSNGVDEYSTVIPGVGNKNRRQANVQRDS